MLKVFSIQPNTDEVYAVFLEDDGKQFKQKIDAWVWLVDDEEPYYPAREAIVFDNQNYSDDYLFVKKNNNFIGFTGNIGVCIDMKESEYLKHNRKLATDATPKNAPNT